MRSAPRLFGAIAMMLVATVVGSCTTATETESSTRPTPTLPAQVELPAGVERIDSVAIVGDSITDGSREALTTVLTSRSIATIDIDAEPSRRIAVGNGRSEPLNGLQVVKDLLLFGVRPDVWVIALGTNDAGAFAEQSDYAALIDEMLGLLPADAPVVWVDIYRPMSEEGTEQFNAALHEAAQQRGNMVIASWYAEAINPDQDVLQDDQLHPNKAGNVVFATVVADALTDA